MKNFLLDMILLSEKRQKVILLLLEGPMTIDTIKKILNASATSIQPQIKMLKEHSLVAQEKNIYKLSEIGKIVAVKLKPLLNTLSFLEENVKYWFERDLTEIPTYLLSRINELGHLTITEPQPSNMFELNAEYVKNAKKAKKLEATIFLTFILYFLLCILKLPKREHLYLLFFKNRSLKNGLQITRNKLRNL
jgi:predicted transcriptional regulator